MNSHNGTSRWPLSIIDRESLARGIEIFLKTHRDGYYQLATYLRMMPPDRTEAEFQQEVEAAAVEHQAATQKILDDYNAKRVAQGLPAVDRQGNPLPSDPAAS
jgi:hypothetical protein